MIHEQLFNWHKMLTRGKQGLTHIGKYCAHEDAMQVVSGKLYKPTIHFEAPPSQKVPQEMDQFISWFTKTHSENEKTMLTLVKSGIAHLLLNIDQNDWFKHFSILRHHSH